MSDPLPRLRDGTGPLAAALRAASAHSPAEDPAKERIWRRLQSPAPRARRIVLAALSAAVAIAVLVDLRQKQAASLRVIDGIAQADATTVRAGAWAVVEAGGVRAALGPGAVLLFKDGVLRLESGSAAFSAGALSRIAAGAAWVDASSAAFVAEVQARRVTVRAAQGAVEVEWDGRRIPLAAGQAFASDGSAPKPSAAAQALQELVVAAKEERARQASRLAEAIAREADDEASAEARAGNALYQLAQERLRTGDPAAALQAVADYRTRFPQGPLAQEAALTAIEARIALSQGDAAVQEIDGFLARWPSSERAAEVRRLRETLLHRRSKLPAP